MFTWIHKNDWFQKKATFNRKGKVEIISTFQRNRHCAGAKKAMSPRHSAYIPSSAKLPFYLMSSNIDIISAGKSIFHGLTIFAKLEMRWFCDIIYYAVAPLSGLQPVMGYLGLALVFVWGSALWERFIFCFSRVFCWH